MNSFDRKVCPHCSESIQMTARKCPYCLSWQGRKASMGNPAFAAVVPMLVVFPFLFYMFHSVIRHSRPFSDYRAQMQVVSAEMNYSVEDGKNIVSTIGYIRNNSELTWEHPAIEVQYFDAAGKLIDTDSTESYSYVLAPHSEQAFRVRSEADKPRAEYVSQKVFIRDAREPIGF